MSLQKFVDVYLLRTAQRCFVVEESRSPGGLSTRGDVAAIPRELWGARVRDATHSL
jgi:hypothetical protein